MSDVLTELKTLLGEVYDLEKAGSVLEWDQDTYMPPGGVEGRAEQMATLARIAHTRATSAEAGRLLDAAATATAALPPDADDARLVQVARRDYELARKLPSDFVAELTRAASTGRPAWAQARQDADFSQFAPHLERTVEISRRAAELLGTGDRPYDALLDYYEPGLTTAQLEGIFGQLKAAIVPLVRQIAERQDAVDNRCLYGDFDEQAQLDFGLGIVRQYGYDVERGRMDLTLHPFCSSFNPGDVRITTRVNRQYVGSCLFAIMHESGHAMYEQGISRRLDRTPLSQGTSPGVHESQSRLWENLVGRSRPFWEYGFPRLQAAFPALKPVALDTFYRAINRVQPSFIRVEADEVTYNLHILLRFELETALLDGTLAVADAPAAWDAKMQEYLGLTPPDARQGILQDIHWSGGFFGIFPGYTLGNVIGAQLFAAARTALPTLDADLRAGEFAALHGWLATQVYQHGRKFMPNELLTRITGGPIDPAAWIAYARTKYAAIYGLPGE